MPQSSGESFMLLLSNTQEHFMSAESAPLSALKRRGDELEIKSSLLFSVCSGISQNRTHVAHKREEF